MKHLYYCLLLLLSFSAYSQDAYVHFNKKHYLPGETVWFKAYLFQNNLPGGTTSDYFVQLVDESNLVLSTKKYPQTGATVKGDFLLPQGLQPGTYRLEILSNCRTQRTKTPIHRARFNVGTTANTAKSQEDAGVQLTFFPEGGNLIDGIASVVAFRATDASGNPVEVSGTVISNDGLTIPFKTSQAGIGSFRLKPQSARTYKAQLEGNYKSSHPLPAVGAGGVGLHIEEVTEGKRFYITRRKNGQNDYRQVKLVAFSNEQIAYESTLDFQNDNSLAGTLVTNGLPSGLLTFEVYDDAGKQLAQRVTFVNNLGNSLNEGIITTKKIRDDVQSLNVRFADTTAKSLALSVTDITNTGMAQHDIISERLLTSKVMHSIPQPHQFVRAQSDAEKQLLNLWLMANYAAPKNNEQPRACQGDDYLIRITGTVKKPGGADVIKGGSLLVAYDLDDTTTKSFRVPVNNEGRFVLDSLYFTGAQKFFYHYTSPKEKPLAVDLEVDVPKEPLKQVYVMPEPEQKAEPMAKSLDTVTVQASRRRQSELVNEKYSSGIFKSTGRIVLDNINNPHPDGFVSIVQFILQNIRTLAFENGRIVNTKNFSLSNAQRWAVEVVYNEQPVGLSALQSTQVKDVAMVKFYEAGFAGGNISQYPGGLVAIYTKKPEGDTARKKPVTDSSYFVYEGYAPASSFVQSTTLKEAAATVPAALYWHPDIYMDEKRKELELTFPVKSTTKKILVDIQGFGRDGRLISVQKIIQL